MDASSPLPTGTEAINLNNMAGGMRTEIAKAAKVMLAEADKVHDKSLKSEMRQAVRDFVSEARGINLGPHSSAFKDGAKEHVDHAGQNKQSFGRMMGDVAGAAAKVSTNPIYKAVATVLMDGTQPSALEALKMVFAKAGVNINTPVMKNAIEGAKENLDTLKSISALRANGFNDSTIYATGGQIAANGGGQKGIKGFIRETAQRLKDNVHNGQNHDLSKTLKRPVIATTEQMQLARDTGKTVSASVSGDEKKKFVADKTVETRKVEAEVTLAVQDPAKKGLPVSRKLAQRLDMYALKQFNLPKHVISDKSPNDYKDLTEEEKLKLNPVTVPVSRMAQQRQTAPIIMPMPVPAFARMGANKVAENNGLTYN